MSWVEEAERVAGMTQEEARQRYGSGEEPIPDDDLERRGAICALVFISDPQRPLTEREIAEGQRLMREIESRNSDSVHTEGGKE